MEKMPFKKTVKKHVTKKNVVKAAKFAYKHRGTAQKALKLAMRLKDAVNIEYKESEVKLNLLELGDGRNDINVADSITFRPMCVPTKGTGENNRIGNSIKLQRLSGRGRISWLNQTTPASGTVTASVRVIIMRGKADGARQYPIAVTLNPPDHLPFLDELGTLGAKADNTKFNTKIVYDKTYRLDIARVNNINLNWNFPLNWHQNFIEGDSNGISDNGLYLGIITDTGGSPKCEFIMNYTVTYTDD